eukprot:Gb_06598 [translate_table: standard]
MYIVRGQPMYGESGWLSDSESEREAPKIEVVSSIQSSIQGSGRDAHSSTSRRINWYEMTLLDDAQERDEKSHSMRGRHREKELWGEEEKAERDRRELKGF